MPNPAQKYTAPIRWRYDTGNTEFAPRSRPFERPVPGIFDAPYGCVRINRLWLPHIIGFLDVGTQFDAWAGDDDGFSGRNEIEQLIAALLNAQTCVDIGVGTLLRQNEDIPCHLEQSQDGGATWTLAFDYSLCQPAPSPLLEYNFQQTITNQFYQWSQTTNNTEINQYAPTETFTSSEGEDTDRVEARKLALCYATKVYIAAYCEAVRQINQDASTAGNLVGMALGIAAAVAAIATASTAGATLPLYLAVSAALTQFGSSAYGALTEAVLDDESAQEEVACLMYSTLKNLEPTAENFATAVNGGTLTGNAELIRATLAVDISNETGLENQFNAFINFLGDSLRPAELGLIDDCPCETPEAATPIFTADWDSFDGLGGADLTDLGGGYWEATSTFVEDHYSLAIQEATGADFALSDVTYPDGGSVSCEQSRFEGVDEVRCDDEPAPPAYDRYGWTWLAVEGPRRVRFHIALA